MSQGRPGVLGWFYVVAPGRQSCSALSGVRRSHLLGMCSLWAAAFQASRVQDACLPLLGEGLEVIRSATCLFVAVAAALIGGRPAVPGPCCYVVAGTACTHVWCALSARVEAALVCCSCGHRRSCVVVCCVEAVLTGCRAAWNRLTTCDGLQHGPAGRAFTCARVLCVQSRAPGQRTTRLLRAQK